MASVPLILVSGASGYIATHVIKLLLENGHRVRGTVRSLENATKVQPLKDLCPGSKHELELVEADLLKKESWIPALEGCTYVFHTASPVLTTQPEDESELIKPAVDGTLSVLEACRQVGGIKRVVLTSSVASVIAGRDADHVFSEEDWSLLDSNSSYYSKSKTLAERAAWDFIKDLPEKEKFELSVINPCLVSGPMLCGSVPASLTLVSRLLERQIPGVAYINFRLIDVRDVAKAHVIAMTLPEAAGKRHILASESLWMKEIAMMLKEEFGPLGYKIPTFQVPNIFLRLFSYFDKSVRGMVPQLGKVNKYDTTRMTSVLGIKPIPLKETLFDTAYSMIEKGAVHKTEAYEQHLQKRNN